MSQDKKRILILGGGFGGIKTALQLSDNPDFGVSLISEQENFRYYPSLYHTATGGKAAASSIPLKEIFAGKAVHIIKDSARSLDRQAKTVQGNSKKYHYDSLVIALGVVTNYFGIKGLEEYAYGIKSQEEAQDLRDHIHQHLVKDKKPDLNYVVIGGGPTGVELAGALPGYIQHVIKRHGLLPARLHIDLVEAAPRLMPRMPRSYSIALQRRLKKLGVQLFLNQAVQAETADQLMISGHPLDSHTVIWTAGVTNHPFLKANQFNLTEHGKALVDKQLRAEAEIYVIGDNADTPYSGMAQTALFDAVFLANNFTRQAKGQSPLDYKAKKPIYVTPVGPHWAAVLWGNTHLYGWIGWALRSAADLVGYHDYEPWWRASQHWIAESENDKTCPICS